VDKHKGRLDTSSEDNRVAKQCHFIWRWF